MRIIGITGWSGAGKTTLILKLIPLLTQRGLRVSTLKHAPSQDFSMSTIPARILRASARWRAEVLSRRQPLRGHA